MARVPCRLAALDLDGTLLNDNHEVTARNCEALRKLSSKEVAVVLVSGRMHQSILPISQQIGLANPIISYNGGMVKHAETHEVYHHTPIPAPLATELVDFCEKRGFHLNYCLDDTLYVKAKTAWSELYETRTGVPATALGTLHKLDGKTPTKLQIIDEPGVVDQLLVECKRVFGGRLYVTRTQIEYIEFMNPEVSKGRALRALADRLDIPMRLVVAFGDGYNDETMMSVAGYRVAMGNAIDEIKRNAHHITDTNHNDGVALAVETLLLDG